MILGLVEPWAFGLERSLSVLIIALKTIRKGVNNILGNQLLLEQSIAQPVTDADSNGAVHIWWYCFGQLQRGLSRLLLGWALKDTTKKNSVAIILSVVAVLISGICDAGARRALRFSPGSVSAMVEESVIRGERDIYYVTARAGQTMEVNISATEDNAVFSIYRPGSVATDKDGFTEVAGKALPKAGETDDATAWKGTLPVSGEYVLVVGGTRGNATYKLQVTIR